MKPAGPRGRWALPLLAAVVTAIAAVNGLDLPLTARRLGALAGGEPVLDLRIGYSPEEAFRLLARLGTSGRSSYLWMLWTVDLFLPVLFGAAAWSALGAGSLARWRSLAVAAAGVDYLENAALSALIVAFPERHPSVALLASAVTAAKFSLYALAAATAGAGAWMARRGAARRLAPGDGSARAGASSSGSYRAIVLTGPGGLDRLEEVRLPLLDPGPGELRVRVIAAGAGATDLTMRRGRYPFAPPFPFVPGYEAIGIVDALGEGVSGFAPGQKVAALTVHGAFAEVLVRGAEHFVPVPDGLDDGEAVALVLNYGTAWQMIHRVAKLRAGQTALVTGANGGVGTALLDLLRDAGVRALGACSERHAAVVRSLGAEPIPTRGAPIDGAVRRLVPDGVDAAFDVVGGAGTVECVRATRRGGIVVGYGFMGTLVGGRPSRWLTLRGFASLFAGARLRGRRGAFYGITLRYRRDPAPFREDLAALFSLLASRRIAPRIAHRLPLLAVRRSQELLEAGGIEGKIVFVGADRATSRGPGSP